VPALQLVQEVAPGSLYVPSPHWTQTAEPVESLKVPAAQAMQASADDEPADGLAVPTGHASQEGEPWSLL
jgi:hypothetical protein